MIVSGTVQKRGFFGFEIASGKKRVSMTTGNTAMWFALREAAKRKLLVKLEGVMETVLFRKKFVPVRFLEAAV